VERHAGHHDVLLTIFGTFMTRSGVVQSVHASATIRRWRGLCGFMVVIVTVSFGS
jgi:cytochrome c biogenesis factor